MKTLSLLLFPSALLAAPDYYVNHAAIGNNDGSSWENAFIKLEDALRSFDPNADGLEVWVATGTYYPDEGGNSTDNDRLDNFSITTNLRLLGGFVGNETLPDQRDPINLPTILSGDIEQNDLDPDGDGIIEDATHIVGTNSSAIINFSSSVENALVDGFIITGGTRLVKSFRASGTVANCQLIGSDNAALLATNHSDITLTHSSISQITRTAILISQDSIFSGNQLTVQDCAGPAFMLSPGSASQGTLTNCHFSRITADRNNRVLAISHSSEGTLQMRSCLFTGISGFQSTSSLIHLDSPADTTVTNCTIHGIPYTTIQNEHDTPGALIFANNIIWGNSNVSPAIDHPNATITHSLIQNETPPGLGNLPPANPLFTNPSGSDFHLQPNSSCLDAGDNSVAIETLDLDGNPRIVDNNDSGTAIINLGAYETTRLFVAPPEITSLDLSATEVTLTLSHAPSSPWSIQHSTNLQTWSPLTSTIGGQTEYTFPRDEHKTGYFQLRTSE